MKFFVACMVYLLLALLLVWAVVLTALGNLWPLIAGALIYMAGFAVLGCLPGKKPH